MGDACAFKLKGLVRMDDGYAGGRHHHEIRLERCGVPAPARRQRPGHPGDGRGRGNRAGAADIVEADPAGRDIRRPCHTGVVHDDVADPGGGQQGRHLRADPTRATNLDPCPAAGRQGTAGMLRIGGAQRHRREIGQQPFLVQHRQW